LGEVGGQAHRPQENQGLLHGHVSQSPHVSQVTNFLIAFANWHSPNFPAISWLLASRAGIPTEASPFLLYLGSTLLLVDSIAKVLLPICLVSRRKTNQSSGLRRKGLTTNEATGTSNFDLQWLPRASQ
jgi:hypothetical protein